MATRSDTSTTDQPPAVIDCEVEDGQTLISVEQGDISVLVAAPSDVDASEIAAALDGVPESIEWAAEHFDGGVD